MLNSLKKTLSSNFFILYALLFLIAVVNVSWMSDDALITLRHVLNFLNGYGPVFNVGERVQAFTHPLWFLLIAFFSIFCNYIFAVFILSFSLSFFTIYLLFKFLKSTHSADTGFIYFLFFIIIILSKAFMDFSASGLENPLSHLLLIQFFVLYFDILKSSGENLLKRLFLLFLLSSLIYLTRMDHVLIVFPSLLHIIVFLYKKNFNLITIAKLLIAPIFLVLLWHSFSLLYYGFFFPNTAYAKLGTGILSEDYLVQGFTYFFYTLRSDPITILAIVLSIFSVLDKKDNFFPSLGVFFYCIYIIKIGGDFMVGRFFSSPFIISLLLLSRLDFAQKQNLLFNKVGLLVVLFCSSVFTFEKNIINSEEYLRLEGNYFYKGIADERAFYSYRGMTFFSLFVNDSQMNKLLTFADNWKYDPRNFNIKSFEAIGLVSIVYGPSTYILDKVALSDPLLSKMPSIAHKNFRIGHFYRSMPDGYLSSLKNNQNLITDSRIHIFYNKILNVVRNDVFDLNRVRDIIFLNLNPLLDYNFDELKVNGENYKISVPNGSLWYDERCIIFNDEQKIIFNYEHPISFTKIELSLDDNDFYYVFIDEDKYLLHPKFTNGIRSRLLNFGKNYSNISKIEIRGTGGDNFNSICSIIYD